MGIESATWYGSIDARLRGHGYDFESDEVVLVCDSDDDDGSEIDGGGGGGALQFLRKKGKVEGYLKP